MTLLEELKEEEEQIIQTRHELHRLAELSFQEFKTTEYLKSELKKAGAELREIGIPTGVCALIRGVREGPAIALRADIDALPIQEESGLSYASEREHVSHSCGHDLHSAALLSAARYLCRHRDRLAGSVWLFFQPAEETLCGAKALIGAGCMKLEPAPESILCYHTYPPLKTGLFGIIRGGANNSCDNIRITIRGKGGHGAYPHRCGDPIVAAGALLVPLQTCVSRDNDSMMPAVLTFGSIHGGSSPNVIPSSVVLEGTLRAVYPESRQIIKESIVRISEHVCSAMRTSALVKFLEPAVPAVHNDDTVIDRAEAAIKKLFGPEAIYPMRFPTAGSEDFALYLDSCPGAIIRFGTQDPNNPATALGVHTPGVQFDDRSLFYAVALLCQYTEDSLSETVNILTTPAVSI